MLRTVEAVRGSWLFAALALAGGLASGVVITRLPTVFLQVGSALAAAATAGALFLAQTGRVLDPAWVVILGLYTIGPLGTVLGQAELGVPIVSLAGLAPAPFVLAAVFMRGRAPANLYYATPLALLFVFATMSLLWSADAAYGAEKLQIWLINSVVPSLFLMVLVPRAGGVSWRLIGLAGMAYAMTLLFFGVETQLYPGRSVLFDGNPIWAARGAFMGTLVVLFAPFPWYFKTATVPLSVVAGLGTDSLGPTLGLVLGACAGGAAWLRQAGATRATVGLLWMAITIAFVLAVVSLVSSDADNGTQILADLAADPNVTSRASYYGSSADLFASSPVGGGGLGSFAAARGDLYPHNLFVEIVAELGIVGSAIFASWLLLAARGATHSPVLSSLLVATVIYSFFSGSLASNVEFWLVSAIAVASITRPGAPPADRPATPIADRPATAPVARPAGP
jgi:hypothetical protein